ncbi:MerR family transcriptional regulator [Planctomonas sp. JC2975]|uniref:MerR family transcriptional regulator n=1 Tax=Planctomonas sp. JC2975 TaxID=2729626 RepID=UPI001475B303|nr:MerR family transcriptional regulator [Planctomonas sp. JC2975]NNC13802.1 MerR family transcriptional regulator [Planctomonas sp. JC2975]
MSTIGIGDFARATHLGVKALRNYDRVGLLRPAEVDGVTGYRRYDVEQISDALLIKRFRDLGLPLDRIAVLLRTENVEERAGLLEAHLNALIGDLERMRAATVSLSGLLDHVVSSESIGSRVAPATHAAAIEADIDAATISPWFRGATAELTAMLAARHLSAAGPVTGLFEETVFTEGAGKATILVPTRGPIHPLGRVKPILTARAELAVVIHRGSHSEIDRSYAALGSHVARHEISTPGPIHETYLTGPAETADDNEWVTEIGWPVFHTRAADAG